jgi:hypothetical protein
MAEIDFKGVSNFYSIGQITEAQPNLRGLTNTTYEIDHSYFITVYHERSSEELESLAEVVASIPPGIPLARPIQGEHGYTFMTGGRPALLTAKLPGVHFVGVAQSDKKPIPQQLHPAFAKMFWTLQAGLTGLPGDQKAHLVPYGRSPGPHSKLGGGGQEIH